jgi:hypothetical protein
MILEMDNIFGNRNLAREKRKSMKRDIFIYDKMTDEKWKKFRTKMDELLSKDHQLHNIFYQYPKDQAWTNNVWNRLESILKDAMIAEIPQRTICKSDRTRRPKLKSDTFKAYKWSLRLIRIIKKSNLDLIAVDKKHKFIDQFKNIIQKYNWFEFNSFDFSQKLFDTDGHILIDDLVKLSKKLKLKLDVEDRIFVTQQIEANVQNRLERFESQKKFMLDSILEREHRKISIDRLLIKDNNNEEQLILSTADILQHTKQHFSNITDNFPADDHYLEEFWSSEYIPLEHVDSSIYNQLLDDISEDEWNSTIRSLPNGKAGGASKITYEIIKECSSEFLFFMRMFYNIIFQFLRIGIKESFTRYRNRENGT